MPRPLRRLIRELQRQREETRQLREKVRLLTSQVEAQGEEFRKHRDDDRRRFILQLPANLAVTLFGGWLLHWWQQKQDVALNVRKWMRDAGSNPRQRQDVRVQRGTHHSVNAGAATWGFHLPPIPADGVTVTRGR